jgi:hypothetical protein
MKTKFLLLLLSALAFGCPVASFAQSNPMEGFKTNENTQFLDSVTSLKKNFFYVKNDLFASRNGLKDRYDDINQRLKDWTVKWSAIQIYVQNNRKLPIRDIQREVSLKFFDQVEAFHKIRLDGSELSQDLINAADLLRGSVRSRHIPIVPGDDFTQNYQALGGAVDTFGNLLVTMDATLYDNLQSITSTFQDLEVAFTQFVSGIYLNDGIEKIQEARRMVLNLFFAEKWYRPYGSKLQKLMIAMGSHLTYKNILEVTRLRAEVDTACKATRLALLASKDLDPYFRDSLVADTEATCTDFFTRVDDRLMRWNSTNQASDSVNYKKDLAGKKCKPGMVNTSNKVNCRAYAWATKISESQINAMDDRQKANLEKLWWAILKGQVMDANALGLQGAPFQGAL